jgi:threonylcarbamoyladenosine tRNA methylthiotransferase MtaB
MKRVALHTLGCKLNLAESSTIARQFRARGYEVVGIDDPADVCVVNTCSVTERADRECRQIVRRALRHSPDSFVVVTGCYAQLQPHEIAAIDGVDLVLGTQEKFSIFEHAGSLRKNGRAQVVVSRIESVQSFSHASSVGFVDRTRAFLKIQDGCDYTCAFCTIPQARGESRSVPIDRLVAEAESIVAQGYKEIVLTGVNVGDYGRKIGASFVTLLQMLEMVEGLHRIRISSIEPNLLTDELLAHWLDSDKLCRHWHIPLQSGSDNVLRSMRRRYLTKWYANRVQRIKRSCPDAGIGVDVIVGFPGETDELFEETYRFLVELPVSYLHVFTYSERPGTQAASFTSSVDPRIRAERSERLRNLSFRKRQAFYDRFLGETVDVLVESERTRGILTGLTDEYVRVTFPGHPSMINSILPVTVESVEGESCLGSAATSVVVGSENIAFSGISGVVAA